MSKEKEYELDNVEENEIDDVENDYIESEEI